MPDEPTNLTHELLREIRAELAAFRTGVDHRFEKIEADMLEVKRTLRGLTYMMATFTGRLEDLETRVDRSSPRP
ncbi:MAG: hypothetical protein JO048_07640 [Methylobacteriaceae bacterium]|nr:hypothetical protein [Methylobacteriaceae bacterium]